MSQQHKYAETYRIDVGTDAMMRRMQAMVAYNTMRQDGEVSGANLLVKRKYSRKHVERNVDSLNPKKNKDMTYYEYGCSTDGLREDLGVANYHDLSLTLWLANLQMMRSVLALLALASASGLSRRTGALAVRGGNS